DRNHKRDADGQKPSALPPNDSLAACQNIFGMEVDGFRCFSTTFGQPDFGFLNLRSAEQKTRITISRVPLTRTKEQACMVAHVVQIRFERFDQPSKGLLKTVIIAKKNPVV